MQLKIIQGTARPWRDRHGPRVEVAMPACPAWLPLRARKYWFELGAKIAAAGLVSMIDGDVFALHCDSLARFADAAEKIRDLESQATMTADEHMIHAALLSIQSTLRSQLVTTAREFGLTPSARGGIIDNSQQLLPLDDGCDNI